MPISEVVKLVKMRDLDNIYDPIIVTRQNKYLGIVFIYNLLDKYSKLKQIN